MKKKVIIIAGPTASGKTNLSIKLAIFFKGEIINSDSVQIYKEFNIGAAKISIKEKKNIKHHLLDKIGLNQKYSIYDFQKDVRSVIPKINIPFLVGGSGLYIKSALFNYEFQETMNNNKKKISEIKLDINQMLEIIEKKDPNLVFDKKNPHRVIRAFRNTFQKTLRSEKIGKNIPLFDILTLYLDIPLPILKERIIIRLEKMLELGFIEEVQNLTKKFPKFNFNIIGYREIKLFLEQKIDLSTAKSYIITKTLRYAKRQKTWFKNQFDSLIILDALCFNLTEKAISLISNFLKKDNN
ncbi:tRNA dimethylallyltransferase [Candidatus Phytoplasma oryzae]|uniref:tRNA dimethylallyltransferase n=1 Tax=Candidatus Phytoplasma oryzae TaxID=203274 RepID=A0A139JR04_9MOLU|nr:tRNA (adenosine(37)-N6)-dimethylallyltransferase MiaA [Candidatus Phytoplasma oryzae]KXT29378.1 tRNA dimethylallyltransferase [Candidatus Phytoplasma oryzae]RAM57963.1 tRNA dimethylallyltransferase [Candidatus Phytoplasma oryzae]